MKNIKKISYQYTRDFKNPINYTIETDTITTSLQYKDAIQIAFGVIDSLNGSYENLQELIERFKKEK